MKCLLSSLVFFMSAQVFAQGHISVSHFRLFENKCHAEEEEAVSATPQSPPLDVDDPGTPGCNRWEINLLVDGDFTKGERQLEVPLMDLNYGVGDNVQLKYEIPMEKTQADGVNTSTTGPSKVGIKYMFYENEEAGTQIGFYPQYSSDKIVSLPLLYTTTLASTAKGDLLMTANVGYNHASEVDTKDAVFVATGLGMQISKNIAIMGEISAEEAVAKTEDGAREELVKANFGAIGSVTKEFSVYGSFGDSLTSSDHQKHLYALMGVRLATAGF